MALKDIYCQDHVVTSLCSARTAQRQPHAYIFAGPDGVGKFTTARAWAKLLLCSQPTTSQRDANTFYDSCGSCRSCIAFDADSHPDFHLIQKELIVYTEEGKNKKPGLEMPVAVVREFLINKISAQPALSDRTVFVMLEAEKLNASSQNAMLKTLEEPPPFATIILICSRLEKMLPTTQSRSRTVMFGPIAEDMIIKHLQQTGVMTAEARYWARFSQGSIGSALTWSTLKNDTISAYDIKKRIVEKLASLRLEDVVDTAEQFAKDASAIAKIWAKLDPNTSEADLGRRSAKGVMWMICCVLNDVMRIGVQNTRALINSDQDALITKLLARYGPEGAADRTESVYRSMDWVDASVNEKLIFEQLLFNLV